MRCALPAAPAAAPAELSGIERGIVQAHHTIERWLAKRPIALPTVQALDLRPGLPELRLEESMLVSDPTTANPMHASLNPMAEASKQTKRPTIAAQLVPTKDGQGVVLVVDGNLAAVARTPPEVAAMAADWAAGAYS